MSSVAEKQMELYMQHIERTKPAVIAVRVVDDQVSDNSLVAEEKVEEVKVVEKKTTKSK